MTLELFPMTVFLLMLIKICPSVSDFIYQRLNTYNVSIDFWYKSKYHG